MSHNVGRRENDKEHRIIAPSARENRVQKSPSFIIENANGVDADLIALLAISVGPLPLLDIFLARHSDRTLARSHPSAVMRACVLSILKCNMNVGHRYLSHPGGRCRRVRGVYRYRLGKIKTSSDNVAINARVMNVHHESINIESFRAPAPVFLFCH